MSGIAGNLHSLLEEITRDSPSYDQFLFHLFSYEVRERDVKHEILRMKLARLPSNHDLDQYDFTFSSGLNPTQLNQLRESHSGRTLRQLEARFEKYDLVICDEFGYVSFDKNGAELLFNHLSLRAGRKATVITTNLSFDRWEEIFGDPVLTAALVDRLTYKAYLVNMNGESYRLKETKK